MIRFRNLFPLARVQPPRASHVPSAAFQVSSLVRAGSASFAPTAPTFAYFRFAQTSGMLAIRKSASRLCVAFAQGIVGVAF
jgi:hypothetical protein